MFWSRHRQSRPPRKGPRKLKPGEANYRLSRAREADVLNVRSSTVGTKGFATIITTLYPELRSTDLRIEIEGREAHVYLKKDDSLLAHFERLSPGTITGGKGSIRTGLANAKTYKLTEKGKVGLPASITTTSTTPRGFLKLWYARHPGAHTDTTHTYTAELTGNGARILKDGEPVAVFFNED